MAKRICTIEGCEKNLRARGYCAMHWRRWRIHGDPSLGGRPIYDPICSIEGCETNSHTRGYCKIHYERIKMNGTIETKVESHGMWQTITYRSYQAMKNRCKSGKKKWYKNVKVCSRWKESFKAFYDDMGERPKNKTLDRIDNDGNYSCGKCEECLKNNWSFNCRWATIRQQNNNTSVKNKTGYAGVSKSWSRYQAHVGYKGKQLYLGSFATPEEAHAEYLKAVELYDKESLE